MYTDSHIHLYDLHNLTGIPPVLGADTRVCASSHTAREFLWQEAYALRNPGKVFLSFGIHPQNPEKENWAFLESLAAGGRIHAIGECGFDLYTPEYRAKEQEQAEVWNIQLELALKTGLPLVVHCRKALHLVFADTQRLKKVRALVFHGWPGSASEASSLLARGINAYFSAGKGLLRGDKSLRATVAALPLSRLLTETDAPYMGMKGGAFTTESDIVEVSREGASLRNEDESVFCRGVEVNFLSVFGD